MRGLNCFLESIVISPKCCKRSADVFLYTRQFSAVCTFSYFIIVVAQRKEGGNQKKCYVGIKKNPGIKSYKPQSVVDDLQMSSGTYLTQFSAVCNFSYFM